MQDYKKCYLNIVMKYSGIFNVYVDNIYCLVVMNVNIVLFLVCIYWQVEIVFEYLWYVYFVVRVLIIFYFSCLN